jgi:hypothetical protein
VLVDKQIIYMVTEDVYLNGVDWHIGSVKEMVVAFIDEEAVDAAVSSDVIVSVE